MVHLRFRKLVRVRLCFIWLFCGKAYLALNLSHRTLTGASTLTSRKNGRRWRMSRTEPSQMSVVTHRCLHLFVTNSRRASVCSKRGTSPTLNGFALGMLACVADFSTEGVGAVRSRKSLLK